MLLAATGFIMIGLLMFFLLKSKAMPMTLFVILPIIGALVNGFGLADLITFITKGVSTTWRMAALFVFVITYFGIMTDVGLFDRLVRKLIKLAGKHILAIFIVVEIVSILGHLDGNSPTTYMITIPALLPLCKKLHIRIQAIMLECCATITVMNLVPWGGVVNRQAIVLGMDSSLLWKAYLPMQLFGLLLCFVLAFILAKVESRHAEKFIQSVEKPSSNEISEETQTNSLARPQYLLFNFLLTVLVFVLLFTTKLPNYFVFMLGDVIALSVNYPNVKEQEERLKAHAPAVISLVATVLSAGVMVGVLNNTGMIVSMATAIINVLPGFLNAHLHLVFAFIGGFLGLAVSPDPLYYGILPVLIKVCEQYGVPAQSVAIAFGIGADSCFTLAPVIASTYLGLAVSGLELKDHMKVSFFPLWIIGLLMIAFGCIIGSIKM